MNIREGHVEAREKLTARLFWRKRGETGYNDAGNCKEYADATTRSLVTRARASNGARFVTDEQPDLCHESYTFLLDEHHPANEQLLKLARRLSDQSQASQEAAVSTIQDVAKGKWYPIGAYNVANVAVVGSMSGGDLVEDQDYSVDAPAGRIQILEDGGVTAGEDLTVTFDTPALTLERYQSQDNQQFHGDLIIEEYNSFHKMWLRRANFTGYINVTEFPNQTGEFGTFRVKVTPDGPIVWQKRQAAENVQSRTETAEAAGASSSSSSSSTASDNSSSSSSS